MVKKVFTDNAEPGVRLREVQETDLSILFEHQMDPEASRMADFPSRDREAFLEHWRKILADDSVITRTILAGDTVVGNLGSWQADGEWNIGYWIGKEFWGRGICSRALALFLEQVETRPLHAEVAPHNVGSRRVLEKCGFVMIGTIPEDGAGPEIRSLRFRLG